MTILKVTLDIGPLDIAFQYFVTHSIMWSPSHNLLQNQYSLFLGRGGGGFLDSVGHEMLPIASITRHLASREPSDFGISGEKNWNVCWNLAKSDLLDSLEGKVLTACGTHLGGDLIQNWMLTKRRDPKTLFYSRNPEGAGLNNFTQGFPNWLWS